MSDDSASDPAHHGSDVESKGAEVSDPDQPFFAQVTAGVYRNADPEVIWRAIQYAIRHDLPSQNPMLALMFVRIAETFPEVAQYLRSVAPSATEVQRSAIKLIVEPPDELRNAAYLPETVQSPGELDLCWSEFLVTGDVEVVKKVIAVLDQADAARPFLNQALRLSDSPKSPAQNENEDDAERFELTEEDRDQLATVGIMVGRRDETGPFEVLSPGDLDLLMWIGLRTQNAACQKIMRSMDESVLLQMSTKGAALWSLQSNAQQHGTVRLECIEAAEQPGGFGRQLLNVD